MHTWAIYTWDALFVTHTICLGLSPGSLTYPPAPLIRILQGLGSSPDASSLEPRYGPCESGALKQRMIRAVASLGEAEV